MDGHISKNYLRSQRKNLGLTQGELAFILGYESGWRISALESGKARPTTKESIIISRLLNVAFDELWPNWCEKIEIDLDTRVRKLMDRLQRSHSGSNLRNRRVVFVLKKLESILLKLPRSDS
jgi:DNA-binding XRE family transcriptional regulator